MYISKFDLRSIPLPATVITEFGSVCAVDKFSRFWFFTGLFTDLLRPLATKPALANVISSSFKPP